MTIKQKIRGSIALAGFLVIGAIWLVVKLNPLVFNESFFGHAHCIVQAGPEFRLYAEEHHGEFPKHPGGYGDALLLLPDSAFHSLAGPGYSDKAYHESRLRKTHLPEEKCGRVYVQGLCETNDPEIVILFDKIPTPGGDHCHGLNRLFAPLSREGLYLDGSRILVKERDWPAFSQKQIELLVRNGISKDEAERLYGLGPNGITKSSK